MKKLLIALTILISNSHADIPSGRYILEKIQCTSGTKLKLGSDSMKYSISLDVSEGEMTMTAILKADYWSTIKLNCTQINKGTFSYSGDSQYNGYLALDYAKCNNFLYTKILKMNAFGTEEQGTFNYTVNGTKLTISNPDTKTLYSTCKKTNSYPVYHYNKI